MDWKREAINDLSQLRWREHARISIPEQIDALEEDLVSLRGAGGGVPVKGGGSHYEDHLINNIVKRAKLEDNLAVVNRIAGGTHKALDLLDERERRALEVLVIDRQPRGVERLAEEWSYENRQIYRIRDRALYNFTIAMYGMADL